MTRSGIIWISWEAQRRTVSLAGSLGARLYVLLDRSDRIPHRAARYAWLLTKTVAVLIRERPAVCCCQNPSIMLAVWLALLRPLFRYSLVVDRHSNFNLAGHSGALWRLFGWLSNLSIRHADLTIVTNTFLADRVRAAGGRAFVLQDRIPRLQHTARRPLAGARNAVFVCSYDEDEPIEEVLEAARGLDPSWHVYVTGNYRPHLGRVPALRMVSPNVTLTGFLDESEYQTLLSSVDVVIVLTKHDHTLLCGAYEALSLGRPCVASDTAAMRAYFRKGFVFTENTPAAIRKAVEDALRNARELQADLTTLRQELEAAWRGRFEALLREIGARLRRSGPLAGNPRDLTLAANEPAEGHGGGAVQ